ncbi:class I SAM-dependent methyltransferase [Methanolobus sp.]|uniref:class I SAM-dependent methyltransferase n=1 Tax=Methanolobus sp. TaxID=1874737 RepID=UPI0025F358FD|nr:class I SAM-dependent methyltransferase [Methanolobus sp.]
MSPENTHICPLEHSGRLDSSIRRWLQNPQKILAPYVREGMDVLEVGCGPGFFTLDIARMVGKSGRVVAVDLQEGMLQIVRDKVRGSGVEGRIVLHRCEAERLGVSGSFDLVFLFYVVHEVPDRGALFREVVALLKDGGLVYVEEPPFEVSGKAFEETLRIAGDAGLEVTGRPKRFPDRAAVLKKP